MSNRILNLHLIKNRTIIQLNEQRIPDRAFRWFVVLNTESFILDAMYFIAQLVDAWIGRRFVGAKFSML